MRVNWQAAPRCGGSMSEVSMLHHTGYTVSDLDRSVEFYRDLLGCEVVATQEKQGGYLAAIVGYPDAHVRMAHLRAPGVDSFFSPPVEVDTGINAGGLALYLRDPDDIPIELFQPPRRTEA